MRNFLPFFFLFLFFFSHISAYGICDLFPSLKQCQDTNTTQISSRIGCSGNGHPENNKCICRSDWTGKNCENSSKKKCLIEKKNNIVADRTN